MTPYYQDALVTLYCGDCLDISVWQSADVLITDPPYGRGWRQGRSKARGLASDLHTGIANDLDTTTRDAALALWGEHRAMVFGDLMLPPPGGCKQVLIYHKQSNAGTRGAMAGFRRDAEAIYLLGPWPSGLTGRSSIISTGSRSAGNPSSVQGRYKHPHAKPLDVMEMLLDATTGMVTDPFAGSGSTLVAAKRLGRPAIGVEINEAYCETTAWRLSQGVLDFDEPTARRRQVKTTRSTLGTVESVEGTRLSTSSQKLDFDQEPA